MSSRSKSLLKILINSFSISSISLFIWALSAQDSIWNIFGFAGFLGTMLTLFIFWISLISIIVDAFRRK